MTARLAAVAAIPVVGLVLLLAALLLLADRETRLRYGGREYRGGATAVVPAAATPTGTRLAGRQVWVVRGRADRIWLQRADGTFQVYRLDE